MRWVCSVVECALLALLAGCGPNLDAERYPTREPSKADLVGTYQPTAESVTLVTKVGGSKGEPSSIQLSADGTFAMAHVPDWWRTSFGKPAGKTDSGSGNWRTAKHQGWWVLELAFPDTKSFAEPLAGGLTSEVNLIVRPGGGYEIALSIGDPDEGREMTYRRVNSTTRP